MPRNATILTIFVASPSDVSEERELLDRIVARTNSLLARATPVRLELLRWERDTSPAFGKDPQSVINKQIPQDFDIFICILWHRIGSATARAESGTIEEYELAKARYDKDPNSVRLMMYFKDALPAAMSDIDADQYQRVVAFRSRVAREGGLYSTFSTAEDFDNQMQMHLMNLVLEWQSQDQRPLPNGSNAMSSEIGSANITDDLDDGIFDMEDLVEDDLDDGIFDMEDLVEDDSDDGIFDMEDLVEEELSSLNIVLQRMNGAIKDVGEKIWGRAGALQSLLPQENEKVVKTVERQRIRAGAKRVTQDAVGDMKEFVLRMDVELPLYKLHFNKALGVFTRAVPIYLEINEDQAELKGNLTELMVSMDTMLKGMEGFRDAVHGLPRISSALVRSRKETERVLQELIDVTSGAKTSLQRALSLLP